MKKILTTFILLCLCTCFVHAQIKVDVDGTVNLGNTSSFVGDVPFVKVAPNGTIHMGKTSVPLFDADTRFEIDAQKIVVRCSTMLQYSLYPNIPVGFQFIPSSDVVGTVSGNSFQITEIVPVVALTGLENKRASIGHSSNNIHRVYSHEIYLSGANLGTLVTSDARLKTNIRELTSVSERIQKLRPVMYDFVKDGSGEDVSKKQAFKNRVGFIAQEVQELFPDLVTVGEDSLLRLDYAGLIPYLTQTIQEQSKTIQEQNKKSEEQSTQIEKLQKQVNDIQTGAYFANFDVTTSEPQRQVANATEKANILHQNTPNPFSNTTTIAYQLAEEVTSAKICIYNLAGKQLQCHELPATQGENTIEVRASSLQAGMYLYSLIVGNQLVDTKRMVLTE